MSASGRAVALLALLAGLGPAAPAIGQTAGGYEVVAVDGAATLTGRVVFEGRVPRARRSFITKDIEVCGAGYRERQEVELGDEVGLRNVVVTIEGIARGKAWPEPEDHYQLSQEGCLFAPHVQVVRSGRELDILNPDPVLHNVHAFELIGDAQRTLFNYGQPPEEPVITTPVRPRRGHEIRIECDAHDFMLGWMYAADTPYTVLVDENGGFSIDGVPPGTYTVQAWHPYLGTREQQVTLGAGATGQVTFTFEPR